MGDDTPTSANSSTDFKPLQRDAKPPQAAAAKPLPRGQKAKQQKIRSKYAEQDEDERDLRLTLLGSKASKHVATGAAPEVESEAASANGSALPDAAAETPVVAESA